MAKKNATSKMFDEMISTLKSQISISGIKQPDIITFCESPAFLNLLGNPGNPIELFPLQKISLKCFYKGSQGNEDVKLTNDEIELLKKENMEYILDKFDSSEIYRQLVLVWGRRSGKDLLGSFIATYEAMRLLEIPGGNPYAYYKIKEGNPIYITTVANSEGQAKILFNEIKNVVLNAPYFQDKIGDIDSNCIYMLTPSDKINNKQREKDGQELTKGSVVILSGHSNSNTLRGLRSFTLFLDEVALYRTTSGSSGGEIIYNSLVPCTTDFRVFYEEDGVMKNRLDSKIILISSPRSKDGVFYRSYAQSFDKVLGKQTFAMRAPTWKVNLRHSEQDLRVENPGMPESEFAMEFGAEFAGTGGEKFVADEYIDRAIMMDLGQRERGSPGQYYFAQIDPASTSNNYAIVVIHVEDYLKFSQLPDERTKKERRKKYIVDHIKVWIPTANQGIDFQLVDDYVIQLSKRFKFAMISYDAYESRQSMAKLRKAGIPVKFTTYRRKYKEEIYRNLENLLISGDLILPGSGTWAKLMELELKNLKREWVNNGFKIKPNPEGDVKSDDCTDALAGACAIALEQFTTGYVKAETCYTPLLRDSGQLWKIGQGTYTDSQFSIMNRKYGIGNSH